MAHNVICIYCKQKFDRDKEPFVQVSNLRYAHKHCAEQHQVQKSQMDRDYEELVNYIENLFGVGYVSAKVAKQIRDFREMYNYTFSGMLGTLVYWYEIKKAPLDKANGGIGIVPYVYDQAKEYYSKLNVANSQNATISNYRFKIREIEITSPQPEARPPKLFNLGDED